MAGSGVRALLLASAYAMCPDFLVGSLVLFDPNQVVIEDPAFGQIWHALDHPRVRDEPPFDA